MTTESYCGNKEQYIEYLEKYMNTEDMSDISCPYCDPDETYRKKSKNDPDSDFYTKIVSFLNSREKTFFPQSDWNYSLKSISDGTESPLGIHLNNKGKCIYLRSDQFGFSAPKVKMMGNRRYPYVKYMEELESHNSCRQVAEWIWNTRTVGGSFIWPIQIEYYQKRRCGVVPVWKSLYNRDRGIGSYIQDREDLTLFEVMHYYDYKENGAINLEEYDHKDDVLFMELKRVTSEAVGVPYMQIWLDHFKSFEVFVEFFMLENFVCRTKEGKLVPKNITNGEPLTEECVNSIKSVGGVIQNLSTDDIEKMLNNVSSWTIDRSKRIVELLDSENNIKGYA